MIFINQDETAAVGEKACSPMNDKYKKVTRFLVRGGTQMGEAWEINHSALVDQAGITWVKSGREGIAESPIRAGAAESGNRNN